MELDDELNAIYEKLKAMNVDGLCIADALTTPNTDQFWRANVEIHKLGTRIPDLAVADNRFCGDTVKMIFAEGGGGSGFYPRFISAPLIHQMLKLGSAEAAIQWLQKVLNTKKATGKLVQALWGVPVSISIQLTPNVKIVPIAEIPDGLHKKWILEDYPIASSLPTTMLETCQPESALVADSEVEPFLGHPDEHPEKIKRPIRTKRDLLNDITLALTAIGPRVAIAAATWFTYDDPDLEAARMGRQTASQFHEILPQLLGPSLELDAKEAADFVRAYLSLTGETQTKLRLGLSRLSQAQRRHNNGDRAVELATALETLLGDNATTEMTHKIKVRLVRLVGGSSEERAKNASIVSKAYDIRSKLVHTGQIDDNKEYTVDGKKMRSAEILSHTLALSVALAKLLVKRGSIPDWSAFDINEQPT